MGGDPEITLIGSKLWLNEDNFVRAKVQYAKVNQSDRVTNQAFPTTDKLKAIDIAWDYQLKPQTLISTRVWAVDSDVNSSDVGAGVGLEWQLY